MAKAISISLASGERAEQRPPRVKLTRETWEKSSDDGVGKEGGGREGARQSEATISRGALMDKRNQRGDGRTDQCGHTADTPDHGGRRGGEVRRPSASLSDNNEETVVINLIPPRPSANGNRKTTLRLTAGTRFLNSYVCALAGKMLI